MAAWSSGAEGLEGLGLTPEEIVWISGSSSMTASSPVAADHGADQGAGSHPAADPDTGTPGSHSAAAAAAAGSHSAGDLTVTVLSLTKGIGVANAGDAVVLSRRTTSRKRPRSKANPALRPPHRTLGDAAPAPDASPDNSFVRVVSKLSGTEIGRLATDDAAFISALIDQNLCEFHGTVLYAPSTLRMFDEIFVSLEARFTASAFMPTAAHNAGVMDDDRPESTERALARKVALGKLFVRLGIEVDRAPTRSNGSIASHAAANLNTDASASSTASVSDPTSITPSDLAAVYKKANQLGKSAGTMQPAAGMNLTLRCYQAAGLAFMYAKENHDGMNSAGMSPLWRRYPFSSGGSFYYNPYSGELSLEFPRENHCAGGILADEMGLGKTIEMLSLIHSSRRAPLDHDDVRTPRTVRVPTGVGNATTAVPITHATLIVCPLNLLAQWRDEITRAFCPTLMRSEVYYGADRGRVDARAYAGEQAPHVVLTTYGNLSSDFSKNRKDSPLFNVYWHRIVLDEAHYIKERATLSARAAYALMATHRWAVTGTPIVNNLDDVYSLIRFLRVEPWCRHSFWNAFVSIPFQKRDPKALDVPQTILEPLLLRRTKDMRDAEGNLVIDLPPKHIETRYLVFPPEEREIYESLTKHSKRKLHQLKSIGKADYLHVFQLLLGLRQACDHPLLIKAGNNTPSSLDENGARANDPDAPLLPITAEVGLDELVKRYCEGTPTEFASRVLSDLLDDSNDPDTRECPICFETGQQNMLLPCLHVVCQSCVDDVLSRREDSGVGIDCPICRKPCTESEIMRIMASMVNSQPQLTTPAKASAMKAVATPSAGRNDENRNIHSNAGSSTPPMSSPAPASTQSQHSARKIILRPMNFRSSTKLDALIADLLSVRSNDPSIKSVVFSQWTSMLDLIGAAFSFHGISFVRMDGSMSQRARETTLATFARDATVTVLLASLRSAGVGLNLTMASGVYLLEPWWNLSVEYQAIDRIHRLGQTRPVYVTRYIISNSVEEKMQAIQQRKAHLAGAVTGQDSSKVQLDELVALLD